MEDFIRVMNSLEEGVLPQRLKKVRIVCVSDTHNRGPPSGFQLPKGDILVHAGDLTNRGSLSELERAAAWLRDADFGTKIVVAGNHELSLDPNFDPDSSSGKAVDLEERRRCRELISNIPGVTYLEHTSTTIELPNASPSNNLNGEDILPRTINIFGSPYTCTDPSKDASEPTGSSRWAFQYNKSDASSIWSSIPEGTDIVITHQPQAGHCDASRYWTHGGCTALHDRISKVRPTLHICGHCHEGRGAEVVRWSDTESEVQNVRRWEDPGAGSKKLSLVDLTGTKGGQRLEIGRESAVVNAAIVGNSYERRGPKEMRKPIVVDVYL